MPISNFNDLSNDMIYTLDEKILVQFWVKTVIEFMVWEEKLLEWFPVWKGMKTNNGFIPNR